MGKLLAAAVAGAAIAFVAAFFAAGAGTSTPARTVIHRTVAPFADPTARAVAVDLAGRPVALRLPPPRHHAAHHAHKPTTTVTSAPATSTPAPVVTAPHYTPPPVSASPKHKSGSGGTGSGTTVVGP
jgi:hypothetical protein